MYMYINVIYIIYRYITHIGVDGYESQKIKGTRERRRKEAVREGHGEVSRTCDSEAEEGIIGVEASKPA